MQKQRSPINTKPSYATQMSSDDQIQMTNDIANTFAESCRLETDFHSAHNQSSQNVNSHHNLYRVGPSLSPQLQTGRPLQYANHGSMMENRDENNMHQKLRRQLSLNPNACDQRILQIQNSNNLSHHSHPEHVHQHQHQHRHLAPSLSGPRTNMSHWNVHQVKFHSSGILIKNP